MNSKHRFPRTERPRPPEARDNDRRRGPPPLICDVCGVFVTRADIDAGRAEVTRLAYRLRGALCPRCAKL